VDQAGKDDRRGAVTCRHRVSAWRRGMSWPSEQRTRPAIRASTWASIRALAALYDTRGANAVVVVIDEGPLSGRRAGLLHQPTAGQALPAHGWAAWSTAYTIALANLWAAYSLVVERVGIQCARLGSAIPKGANSQLS